VNGLMVMKVGTKRIVAEAAIVPLQDFPTATYERGPDRHAMGVEAGSKSEEAGHRVQTCDCVRLVHDRERI